MFKVTAIASQNSGSRFASSGQSKTSIERFVNVGASNNAETPELNTPKNVGSKVNSAGSGERFVKGSKETSFITTRQKVQEVSKHHVVTTEKKVFLFYFFNLMVKEFECLLFLGKSSGRENLQNHSYNER